MRPEDFAFESNLVPPVDQANVNAVHPSVEPQEDELEMPEAEAMGMPQPQDPRPGVTYESTDKLIDQMRASAQQRSLAAYKASLDIDPDRAAEARRIATELNIDFDTANSNFEEMRKIAQVMQFKRFGIDTGSPVMAHMMSDPEFAKVARTEVQTLAETEKLWRWFSDVGDAFTSKALQTELGRLSADIMWKGPTDPTTQETYKRIAQIKLEMEKLTPAKGFIGGGAGMVGQMWRSIAESIATGFGTAGAFSMTALIAGQLGPQVALPEEVATVPAAWATGFVIGFGGRSLANAFTQEAGLQYDSLMDELAPAGSSFEQRQRAHDTAKWSGLGTGLTNMWLEALGQYGLAVKPVASALSRSVTQKVAEAMARPTMLEALRRAGVAVTSGVLGELGTEYTQEVVSIRFEKLAKQFAAPEMAAYMDTPEGQAEIAERIYGILEETIYSVGLISSVGPGAGFYYDAKRVQQAKRAAAKAAESDRIIANNGLAKREPAALEAAVNNIAAAYDGNSDRFIDAERLTQVLDMLDREALEQTSKQSGVPIDAIRGQVPVEGKASAKLRELLPDVAEQLTSLEDGTGHVKITWGQWASKLAGTDFGAMLSAHMKETPDALSPFEAAQAEQLARDRFAKLAADSMKANENRRQIESEAKQIQRTIRDQLMQTGKVTRREAWLQAEAVRNMYVVMAGRSNMTPAQLFAKMPYRTQAVAADMTARQAGVRLSEVQVRAQERMRNLLQRQLDLIELDLQSETDQTKREQLGARAANIADSLLSMGKPPAVLTAMREGGAMPNVRGELTMPTREGHEFRTVAEVVSYYADDRGHGDEAAAAAVKQVVDELYGEGTYRRLENPRAEMPPEPIWLKDDPHNALELAVAVERRATLMRMEEESEGAFTSMADERQQEDADIVADVLGEAQQTPAEVAAQKPAFDKVQEKSRIQSANRLANSQEWDTNRQLKVKLQEAVRTEAEAQGVELTVTEVPRKKDGTPEKGGVAVEQVRQSQAVEDYLVSVGLSDALFALEQNPNAVGWYDLKTRQAIRILSLIHPEILDDENARFAFTWILATTSNGLKVEKNFEIALAAYTAYKKTGVMPTDVGIGNARNAINDTLGSFNTLREALGMDRLRKLMLSRGRAVIFEQITEREVGGEWADTDVLGAAVLGPKIGNGFFANLYGMFDQLTMDRWLIRTWGRWTGTLINFRPDLIEESKDRLLAALQGMTPEQRLEFATLLLETRRAAIRELAARDVNQAPLWQMRRWLNDGKVLDDKGVPKAGPDVSDLAPPRFVVSPKTGKTSEKPRAYSRKLSRAEVMQVIKDPDVLERLEPLLSDNGLPVAAVAKHFGIAEDTLVQELASTSKWQPVYEKDADGKATEKVIGRRVASSINDAIRKAVDQRIAEMAKEIKPDDILKQPAEETALSILKLSMDPTHRAAMNAMAPVKGTKQTLGEEARKSGNALAKYVDGQREAPTGPGERVYIRKVFGRILQELRKDPKWAGLTMADLQAVLWYAERRIYETAKKSDIELSDAVEGYEDTEAPDYAVAATNQARKAGVAEDEIQKALQEEARGRTARVEPVAGEAAEPSAGAAEGAAGVETRGLTADELKFLAAHKATSEARANRGGPKGASWSIDRRPAKGVAGLWVSLVDKVVKLGQVFKNRLEDAGINVEAKVYQLKPGRESAVKFHEAISDFKKRKEKHGASVDVLGIDEYEGMTLFMSESGKSGVAVKPDGEIVSLFSGDKTARVLMEAAIDAGGTHATAFDIGLGQLYSGHGGMVVARIQWDDAEAPKGWDYEHFKGFNNGRPDVLFLVFDPKFARFYDRADGGTYVSYGVAQARMMQEAERIKMERQATAKGGVLTSMQEPQVPAPKSLQEVLAAWDELGVDSAISEKDGVLTLSKIVVPAGARGQGIGTRAMQTLMRYADATKQRIALSPSGDFGGTKTRLVDFYKALGFYENKGRSKDFTIRETMIREPADLEAQRLTSAQPDDRVLGTFDPKSLEIMLFNKSNFRTVVHETGHFFMEMLFRMARMADAPADVKADANVVLDWFGIGAKDMPFEQRVTIWDSLGLEGQRKHHEAWALNFEMYQLGGKAPSLEMQTVFDKFAAWLRKYYDDVLESLNRIYKRSFGTDLPMFTPEVKGVLDRMLAAEHQIAHAERVENAVAQFQTKEEALAAGMTEAQWEAYQSMLQEARDAAVTDLSRASIQQMQWIGEMREKLFGKISRQANAIRARIREEVRKKLEKKTIHIAQRWLRSGKTTGEDGAEVKVDGPHKLNRAAVEAIVTSEAQLVALDPYLSKDGLPIDTVGNMFGMSGSDLIRQLSISPSLGKAVEDEVNARMVAEYGDMATPEQVQLKVSAALHNEARARFVAMEARWLESAMLDIAGDLDPETREARARARDELVNLNRRRQELRDELRALREAQKKGPNSPDAQTEAQYQATIAGYEEQLRVLGSAISRQQRLANQGIPTRVLIAAKKIAAQKIIAATKVADLRPDRFGQAAGRAARASQQASKNGDMHKALYEKTRQLLQTQLVKASVEARDFVAKSLKAFRKINGPDDKLAKTRNMDLIRVARSILAAYGLGRSDTDIAANMAFLREYNKELADDVQPLIDAAVQNGQSHRNLTYEQFQLLADTIAALDEESRNAKLVEIEGQQVQVDDAAAEFEVERQRLEKPGAKPGTTSRLTPKESFKAWVLSKVALLRNIESWCWTLDGKKPKGEIGPFTKYFYRPMAEALTRYRVLRNQYVKRLSELLGTIELKPGPIEAPELNWTFGKDKNGMGKAELIGALLHTGNESNLRKMLLGYGWATELPDGTLDTTKWDKFIERMIRDEVLTKADFDYVQSVWDVTAEILPRIQRAHRKVFGFDMDTIPNRQFSNRFGQYKGGYVPAKVDPTLVTDAQRFDAIEQLESDVRQTYPSARSGFRHKRVEYNRKLLLDVRMVARHVDESLLFAEAQPIVKQTMRLLKDRRIAESINAIDPYAINTLLVPWLVRSARQITTQPGMDRDLDRMLNTIRRRGTLPFMFANPVNALQQPTGLLLSATRVKPRNLAKALMALMDRPSEIAAEIAKKSPFMDERMHGQIQEVRENMDAMLRKPSLYNDAVTWTEQHGYFLQRWLQNPVDLTTWWAAYNESLAELPADMAPEVREKKASLYADSVVRQTQGSREAENVAKFEVVSAFGKWFQQFMGYSNMVANLNIANFQQLMQDQGWKGGAGKNGWALGYMYLMGFAAPMFLSAVIVQLAKGGWDDEEDDGYADEILETFFGSQVRGAISMAPGFGPAALATMGAFTDKTYDDRMLQAPAIAAMEASGKGLAAAYTLLTEDKAFTGRDLREVFTLLTMMSGLPFSGLSRPGAFLLEVERGKQRPEGVYDWATGLMSGRTR